MELIKERISLMFKHNHDEIDSEENEEEFKEEDENFGDDEDLIEDGGYGDEIGSSGESFWQEE